MPVKRLRLPQSVAFPIRIAAVHVTAGQSVTKGEPVYTLKTGNGAQGVMRAPVTGVIVEGPLLVGSILEHPASILAIDTEAFAPVTDVSEPATEHSAPLQPSHDPRTEPRPTAPQQDTSEPEPAQEPEPSERAEPLVLQAAPPPREEQVTPRRVRADEPIRSVIPEDPPSGRGRFLLILLVLALLPPAVAWMWPAFGFIFGQDDRTLSPAPEIATEAPISLPSPLAETAAAPTQPAPRPAPTIIQRPAPSPSVVTPASQPAPTPAEETTATPTAEPLPQNDEIRPQGFEITQGYVIANGAPLHGPYDFIVALSNDLVITGRCTLRNLGNDIRDAATGQIVKSITNACATPVTGMDGVRDGSYVITTPREHYPIKCRSNLSLTPCGDDAGIIYDRRFLNAQGEVTRRCVGRDYSVFFPDFIGAEC